RIQVHRDKDKIELFTRRLENVTHQFPDVVEAIKKHTKNKKFILDCEAVGYNPKTKKYVPFQKISQRIRRKYEIKEMAEKFPMELNVFDIIDYEGKSTIKMPFEKRRKLIEDLIEIKKFKITTAKQIVTDDENEAEKFYAESLKAGNEGVMMKNLEAPYKPGSRVGFMIKYKPTMKELDLVIVGAEWGTGKRGGWLSSYVWHAEMKTLTNFWKSEKWLQA
ncbi:DNA ligase, partial [Candidatus Woesearchaeota archaeon]|nr:DNA ligase [Candidatus Woesearchaeota archaeon]